jgi:hypothetical protein
MRQATLAAVVALALALAGCGGEASSSGVTLVSITAEELDSVPGNRCAMQGHAANTGNARARVRLRYEARNASGTVIGESTADFEVAGFSHFEFRFGEGNQDGQPSSRPFSNDLACGAIHRFERVDTDIDQA